MVTDRCLKANSHEAILLKQLTSGLIVITCNPIFCNRLGHQFNLKAGITNQISRLISNQKQPFIPGKSGKIINIDRIRYQETIHMMIHDKIPDLADSRMVFRFIHHNPSLNKKEAGLSSQPLSKYISQQLGKQILDVCHGLCVRNVQPLQP